MYANHGTALNIAMSSAMVPEQWSLHKESLLENDEVAFAMLANKAGYMSIAKLTQSIGGVGAASSLRKVCAR